MTGASERGHEVLSEARSWLGTPYRHQGRCRGAGADCLGLVLGVWQEVIGPLPEIPPSYSADWGEMGRQEVLWDAALRHLCCVGPADVQIGDVLLFRMMPNAIAKHLGIQSADGAMAQFIHAYSGRGVVEPRLSGFWERALCARFRFPKGTK